MRRLPALVPAVLLASASVGAAGPPATAAPGPPAGPEGPWCGARAIPVGDAAAGRASAVRCFGSEAELSAAFGVAPPTAGGATASGAELPPGGARALAGDVLWAVHRDIADVSSDKLYVYGPSPCTSSLATQLAGTAWNDRISITTHYACGAIKHWQHQDFTGLTQVTNGAYGAWVAMTEAMNNQTTVIRYTA